MAKLSKDDVLKLARLAKLQLTDAEVEKFQTEISSILGYVEQLKGLKLDATQPTIQVTGLSNVMRPDVIRDYGITPDKLLKNAPGREGNLIRVRRVL
jgi:aspartyl-tRNA(Asn)/glutamyl-tRNA(Gln) amidotransferase subunit C